MTVAGLGLEGMGEGLVEVARVVVAGGAGGVGVLVAPTATLINVVKRPWSTVAVDVFSQPQELSQTIARHAEFALQVSCCAIE